MGCLLINHQVTPCVKIIFCNAAWRVTLKQQISAPLIICLLPKPAPFQFPTKESPTGILTLTSLKEWQ